MVSPSGPTSTDANTFQPTTSLVGRGKELSVLRERVAALANGTGGLVIVAGEAGIGKTALLRTVCHEAERDGPLVLTGHCYDLTQTPPFGPWIDLLDVSTGSTVEPTELRKQILNRLAEIAAAQPVVAVLEDLHWADPASLDLLRTVVRVTDQPLLVIATYRTDELDRDHPLYRLIPVIARETDATRIDLRRLSDQHVRTMVRQRYRLSSDDEARLLAYLTHYAEGLPFYLDELLRSLEETGALLPQADGRWQLASLDARPVAPHLEQVINARIDRLGPDARQPLAIAALIGQDVPLDLWAHVASLSETEVVELTERALAARLFETAETDSTIRLAHALIRQTLYDSISPLRRRSWHRRIAEALLDDIRADPDAVAHHLRQAGDLRSVEWLVRAGERAQRAYAWTTAADRYAAAASALADIPERAAERGWLLYRSGRMLRYIDADTGVAALETAERIGRAAGDAVLAAYALCDRGLARNLGGQARRGQEELERGVAAIDDLPPDHARPGQAVADWIADALPPIVPLSTPPAIDRPSVNTRRGVLADMLAMNGRLDEAISVGERYLTEAEVVPEPDPILLSSIADAYNGLSRAYAGKLRVDDATRAHRQARLLYERGDHYAMAAGVIWQELFLVAIPCRTTDRRTLRALAAAAEAMMQKAEGAFPIGFPVQLVTTPPLFVEGAWREVRDATERGLIRGHIGARHEATYLFAAVSRGLGETDAAWDQIRSLFPDGPGTPPGETPFFSGLRLQSVAIQLCLDSGDLPTAAAWLQTHTAWLDWANCALGRAENALLWADYHRLTGDLPLARQHALAGLEAATHPDQPLARLAAHRLLAVLDVGDGRIEPALRHIGKSLEIADACAAPFERALTLVTGAECISDQDPAAARTWLDEARTICERIGAAPTLARIDAAMLQLTSMSESAAPLGGLSAREIDVLRLVALGLTDAETANRLSISPRTVGQHLRSIYTKLDVPSRTAATRWAIEHNVI